MASLVFCSADIDFTLPEPRKTSSWIKAILLKEKRRLDSLSYIFCKDSYLLTINRKFLHHNTYTDIITFDLSEKGSGIMGEIYISVERVAENSAKFRVDPYQELHRVIVHGILHLCGYNDKSKAEKLLMRKKEEAYLSLLK